MAINEEIIAAYIEGKVSKEERQEIRRYLSVHPETRDLILAIMGEDINVDFQEEQAHTVPIRKVQSFSDISFAAAAFAPRSVIEHKDQKKIVEQRLDLSKTKMSELWEEVNVTE